MLLKQITAAEILLGDDRLEPIKKCKRIVRKLRNIPLIKQTTNCGRLRRRSDEIPGIIENADNNGSTHLKSQSCNPNPVCHTIYSIPRVLTNLHRVQSFHKDYRKKQNKICNQRRRIA